VDDYTFLVHKILDFSKLIFSKRQEGEVNFSRFCADVCAVRFRSSIPSTVAEFYKKYGNNTYEFCIGSGTFFCRGELSPIKIVNSHLGRLHVLKTSSLFEGSALTSQTCFQKALILHVKTGHPKVSIVLYG